ncbi:hypothetical protein KJZ63_01040 [Patescibacteria group bacterium]|nr:hypothetical protein [Patescibacteria group bacterium]
MSTQSSDAVYGFGVIGALIYFITTSPTFGEKLLGVLKALVWPAYLVYHLLKFFKIG